MTHTPEPLPLLLGDLLIESAHRKAFKHPCRRALQVINHLWLVATSIHRVLPGEDVLSVVLCWLDCRCESVIQVVLSLEYLSFMLNSSSAVFPNDFRNLRLYSLLIKA